MSFIELDGLCFGYYWNNGHLVFTTAPDLISCIKRLGAISVQQKRIH